MIRRMGFVTVVALALACSSSTTQFVSSWKAPDAEPLAFRDSKVVAVVMATNPTLRREAEDTLAREITERGAQGVAMYRILEEANSGNEDEVVWSKSSPGRVSRTAPSVSRNAADTAPTLDISHDSIPPASPRE